jgi:hypothetical protein
MAREIFYEIYRRLSIGRSAPEKAILVLDEFAHVCREVMAETPDALHVEAGNCLHEIAQSPTVFAVAVAKWLTNQNDVPLAKALVHKSSVRHLQAAAAVSYDLSLIDESMAVLAGCRLCAFFVSPAISLGWALSLAVSLPRSVRAQEAAEALLQHHIEQYPRTTRHLLAAESSPFKSVDRAAAALEILEAQDAWLSSLPDLREFSMTPKMRLAYASLKRRESREIGRQAREKSIFMQICKVDRFKYANKTSVEHLVGDQAYETMLEMTAHSIGVELPISEQSDPLEGTFMRNALWKGLPK